MAQSNGLEKTFVDINLTGGVNRKRDAHQLRNGELMQANNVIFTNIDGQLCKRNGFAAVTPQGAAFQGGPFKAIGCRDNVEPLVVGNNTLNRYNPATNLSTSLALPSQGRLEVQQCAGSSGKPTSAWPPSHPSCASDGSKYVCVVWAEPNVVGSYMYYGVQDLQSGNWIISPRSFTNAVASYTGSQGYVFTQTSQMEPAVRYVYDSTNNVGYFWLYWIWTGTSTQGANTFQNAVLMSGTLNVNNLVNGITYNSFAMEIVAGQQMVANVYDVSSSPSALAFDVAINSGRYVVAVASPLTAQTVYVSSGTIAATVMTKQYSNSYSMYATGTYRGKVAAAIDTSGNIAISSGLQLQRTNFALTTNNSLTYTNNNTPSFYDVLFNGSLLVTVYLDNNTLESFVYFVLNTTSGTAADVIRLFPETRTYYCELLSRAFVGPNGRMYIWIGCAGPTSDAVYNTALLYEIDPVAKTSCIVARTLYAANFHLTMADKLRACEMIAIPGTSKVVTFLSAGSEKVAELGNNSRAYGTLTRIAFDPAPARQVQIVSLPTGGVLIAGAYPQYYDGNDVVAAGFTSPPTGDAMANSYWNVLGVPTVTQNGGTIAGGSSTSTTSTYIEYQYVVCFVRRDSYGNVYRSAPSPVITIPAIYSQNSFTFAKYSANGGGNIQIEFYRNTQTTPSTYYRVGIVPNGQAFTDTLSDSRVLQFGRPTVYTNSGELPNDPPPAIHHIALSEQRAFVIPADNRNVIWYSKQFSPGRTVEFSASLTLSEGLNSGQFEAIAVMDSYIVVFKKDQVIYTYGAGPDNTGANGGFAPFQKIASDVGCIEAASVAVIPDGVVFKSRRGIELLTRNLQVQYIGGQVEDLVNNNGPLSSVVLMPNFTELRFIPATATATGLYNGVQKSGPTYALTYDYAGKRWSTQSNLTAVQAVNINNDYWFISADGTNVFKETPGVYLDNGTPILMTIETPEIPVANGSVQGWGRVYRMALLGDFFSNHSLKVSYAYDHQTAYTDSSLFSTTSGLISGDTVYQFRASRIPRSTMQTLKLKFEEQSASGQSCAISDLVLEVAAKSGLAKLPLAKTL